MKMRKLAAAAVTAALGLSLAAPAMAAEAADQRLTQVAQKVIATLEIPEEYTGFYGEPNETPLGTKWQLSWEGDGEGLIVTATDSGKVLSMNRWDTEDEASVYRDSYGPSFPAMTREQAREKAQVFLDRVLAEGEAAVFSGNDTERLSAQTYAFGGTVTLNGLDTPLSFSLRVRLSDGAVTSFWRDDSSEYAGSVPAPDTSTTAEKAAELLKGTMELRLEYVRDTADGPAVLRYLPESGHDFYVDAATGELVDLTELQEHLRQNYTTGSMNKYLSTNGDAAAEAAAVVDRGLTDAELEGIAKLEGVLDQEALDKAVRAWKELNLGSFQLAGAAYSVDRESGDVTARLTYAKNTEQGIARRNVTVDAKTGELQAMSGYDPYDGEAKGKLDESQAQAKAEAFLKALWSRQFAETERYSVSMGQQEVNASFTFAHKVNGYFFPANAIRVQVNCVDGSILGFSKYFDDNVTFDSAEGLISKEAALDAWAASFPVELAYIAVPVELDMREELLPLRNAGYSYYNALKPGYELGDRDGWYTGVDAKTGELVKEESGERTAMTYDDIAGHWAAAALTELARYDVGWWGGKAQPDKALTQLDYVKLLASADGYTFYPENGDIEFLYDYAVRRGFLTREEKDPDKALTRAEMVKMLLDSLGYGPVAQLPGIFRCDFADAQSIPAAELGYAALAQGLGIVSGDSEGNYAPARPATRGEAAAMLWQYMKR